MPNEAVRNFDLARARLSYAAAILHTIDLDRLATVHERLASPQALMDGIGLGTQRSAEDWLAVVKAAQAFRDATPFDDGSLTFVETSLPMQLQPLPTPHYEPGDDLVSEDFACPACGERRVDQLQLNDDDSARCLNCGQEYQT